MQKITLKNVYSDSESKVKVIKLIHILDLNSCLLFRFALQFAILSYTAIMAAYLVSYGIF